jgi:hypothetical protein
MASWHVFYLLLAANAASHSSESALEELKQRAVDFVSVEGEEWLNSKQFQGKTIYPSVGQLCRDSAPKHWPRPQRLERLQLCYVIDSRSLDIRLDLAVQHADMGDFDTAEGFLQGVSPACIASRLSVYSLHLMLQLAEEAYNRHAQGKPVKSEHAIRQYTG